MGPQRDFHVPGPGQSTSAGLKHANVLDEAPGADFPKVVGRCVVCSRTP